MEEEQDIQDEVEHFECSACDRQITKIVDDDVEAETHFDISRSNKQFSLEGSEIVEDKEERNTKMLHQFCEECFTRILNESPTLAKIFINKEKGMYIY